MVHRLICWIGDRTRQLDGAHVEYMRDIPAIGLKCGPSLEADELLRLIDILNRKTSRPINSIVRMGAEKVRSGLPLLVLSSSRFECSMVL